MSNLNYYRIVINNILNTYASHTMLVYKYVTAPLDIYRQGAKTFQAGVEVTGQFKEAVDMDVQHDVGREDKAEVSFTFSKASLETSFPLLAEQQWITNNDIIEHNGIRYTVVGVEVAGWVHGSYTNVVVYGREFPDEVTIA